MILINFKLSLNNPSKIAELQELEHWKMKFDIAGSATEGYFSRRWVTEHIFNMSHEEFIRCQREMYYDRKQDASPCKQSLKPRQAPQASAHQAVILAAVSQPAESLIWAAMKAETLIWAAMKAHQKRARPTKNRALLAAPPGSRDSPRLTPGAKGKTYYPVKTDSQTSRRAFEKLFQHCHT